MATKVRFDSLDVQAMVAHLQSAIGGRRIVNIYDGFGGESYIFKLEGDTDKFLLLESGIRFHSLQNFSAESTVPSPFASKLRKHLRGLRLEKVTQIGQDRVVLFQCGAGEYRHSVILELYAKGNLILTDKEYTVLALLRSHLYQQQQQQPTTTTTTTNTSAGNTTTQPATSDVAVQVGQVYPVSYATNLQVGGAEATTTTTATAPADEAPSPALASSTAFNDWASAALAQHEAHQQTKKKKKKGNNSLTLKLLLSQNHASGVTQLGPALVEHCILTAGLSPNAALVVVKEESEPNGSSSVVLLTDEQWALLRDALVNEGPRILSQIKEGSVGSGYILCRPLDAPTGMAALDENLPHADKIFVEFLPILLKQHEDRLYIECEHFGGAVEEFFERIQMQKAMQKAVSAEKSAMNRLEKVKADQQQRLDTLREQQETLSLTANTVQMHAESVEKALAVINSALDSGMDWTQLEQVVAVEQENKNPIALLIQKLLLEEDAMLMRLPTTSMDLNNYEDDETIDVKVLLQETAHGNAKLLFEKYRAMKDKAEKTVDASEKALKAAEETAQRQREEAQKRSKQSLVATTTKRKPFWFEKFHWFITSDNYLVLGGKDAHQNEQLVKRYLRPGDAYLHADVHGAASCILRAKRRRKKKEEGTEPIPLSEQSLREAGHFTICRSSAWASRIVTSAWWVESHQVSKTAPTGEYLTVGSFMVRGKKNFLPPTPLEMGFGVMFRLGDDESILRHRNERRDFALLQDDDGSADESVGRASTPQKQVHTEVGFTESQVEQESEETKMSLVDDPLESKVEEQPLASANKIGQSNEQETGGSLPQTNQTKQKRGLSVKERKLIKKYGSLEAAATANSQQPNQEKDAQDAATNLPKTDKPEPPKPKRGKKAKEKKAMRKYADQDDEDRELAMLALQGGSKNKKDSRKKGNRLKHSVQPETLEQVAVETVALLTKDSAPVADTLDESVGKLLAEVVSVDVDGETVVKWNKIDADILEQLKGLDSVEAQVAAATRLLTLKQTTRVDNFSSSLGGKSSWRWLGVSLN